jgi:hypothetical protein
MAIGTVDETPFDEVVANAKVDTMRLPAMSGKLKSGNTGSQR